MLRAYQVRAARLRAHALAAVSATWAAMGDHRDADVDRFVGQVVPLMEAAQGQTAILTAGYLNVLERVTLGSVEQTDGVTPELVSTQALRGVSAETVWRRPGIEVWSGLARGASYAAAVQQGLSRAKMLGATNLQLAKTHSARHLMSQKSNIVGYRRTLTGATSCAFCAVASTQRYRKADLMPLHPHCVIGDTVVSGPEALRCTRRRNVGEGVVLGTAAGDRLTVTPNHPVLTDHGWIPAGMLKEGDYVVRCPDGQRVREGVPDEDHMPARIKDRFCALAMRGFARVPLAAEDFHGDIVNGEINIEAADRRLRGRAHASPYELVVQDLLTGRIESSTSLYEGSSLEPFGLGASAPSRGGVGGGRLDGTLLGGHLGCASQPGGASASDLDAGSDEVPTDHSSIDSISLADGEFGLTCDIAGDGVSRNGEPTGPKFDAPSTKFAGQGRTPHAGQGACLLNRLAGQVELDRLVLVRRIDLSSCHVFNLQTSEGWYAAGGLIVSNCDCGVTPIYGSKDPGQVIDPERLRRTVETKFGPSGGDGSVSSYRSNLVVHEHGEVGPMLGLRGEHFDGPSVLV